MDVRHAIFIVVVVIFITASQAFDYIKSHQEEFRCLQYHVCECDGELEKLDECYKGRVGSNNASLEGLTGLCGIDKKDLINTSLKLIYNRVFIKRNDPIYNSIFNGHYNYYACVEPTLRKCKMGDQCFENPASTISMTDNKGNGDNIPTTNDMDEEDSKTTTDDEEDDNKKSSISFENPASTFLTTNVKANGDNIPSTNDMDDKDSKTTTDDIEEDNKKSSSNFENPASTILMTVGKANGDNIPMTNDMDDKGSQTTTDDKEDDNKKSSINFDNPVSMIPMTDDNKPTNDCKENKNGQSTTGDKDSDKKPTINFFTYFLGDGGVLTHADNKNTSKILRQIFGDVLPQLPQSLIPLHYKPSIQEVPEQPPCKSDTNVPNQQAPELSEEKQIKDLPKGQAKNKKSLIFGLLRQLLQLVQRPGFEVALKTFLQSFHLLSPPPVENNIPLDPSKYLKQINTKGLDKLIPNIL